MGAQRFNDSDLYHHCDRQEDVHSGANTEIAIVTLLTRSISGGSVNTTGPPAHWADENMFEKVEETREYRVISTKNHMSYSCPSQAMHTTRVATLFVWNL